MYKTVSSKSKQNIFILHSIYVHNMKELKFSIKTQFGK